MKRSLCRGLLKKGDWQISVIRDGARGRGLLERGKEKILTPVSTVYLNFMSKHDILREEA